MKTNTAYSKCDTKKINFKSIAVVATLTTALVSSPLYAGSHVMKDSAASEAESSYSQLKEGSEEFLMSLKSYAVTQKDEALAMSEVALDDLDSQIDVLEDRIDKEWSEMTQPVKAESRATLRALRKQRNEVAEWYGSFKYSTDEAWSIMKSGFSDAYAELYEAWNKAAERYDSEDSAK